MDEKERRQPGPCPMRQGSTCSASGGFCPSVGNGICRALRKAYEIGYFAAMQSKKESKRSGGYRFPCPSCGHVHREPFYTCEKCGR